MSSLGIDASRSVFEPIRVVLILFLSVSFGELQADDTAAKVNNGQVFEPAQTGVRKTSRRRSRRRLPTVSNIILPSLTPAVDKKNPPPVVITTAPPAVPTPRYGYGSNLDNPPPVNIIVQPAPVYIFSPRYNNTQYWPVNRYYGYGYYSSSRHHYSGGYGGHHSYSHGGHHSSGGGHH